MGNLSKWLWGLIILGIVAAIFNFFTPWGAKAHSANMGKSVQSALDTNGHDWAIVEMAGNVAKLSGEATSKTAKAGAIDTASNAKCDKCSDADKRWHEVDGDAITIKKAIPTASPYTLSGVRTDNGGIVLNGYVRDENEKEQLFADANALFVSVTDNKVTVARGAPNENWYVVAKTNLEGLARLNNGEFSMEGFNSVLRGQALEADTRSAINASISVLPASFNGATNIVVPNTAAENTGVIQSESICQGLFQSLKGDNKINFASGRAEIAGAPSIALLNSMASAANQCSAFRVSVEGHTDADGPDVYNLDLSQRRADAVVEYLINNGVNANNISAIGYGETNPIASNDTPEGMAKNRRIEFKVTRSK